MTFGQLIECNMRNIFVEKAYAKCGGETSPILFSEKIIIEHIPGSIHRFTANDYVIFQEI